VQYSLALSCFFVLPERTLTNEVLRVSDSAAKKMSLFWGKLRGWEIVLNLTWGLIQRLI
jgi:hypothetical protein